MSECDKYDRIRRLERDAEAEKRKHSELNKKKSGKSRKREDNIKVYKFKNVDFDDYDD
jgi:hypothetical protein